MKNKVFLALFAGVFLALCLSLSLGTLVFGPAGAAANERLAELPSIKTEDGRINTDFLQQLQSYVNDRFFLRQKLITLDRRMSNALGVSGESSVIAGKDGWLFFTQTLGDYTGTEPMSTRELFSAASNVALMEEYCRTNGKEFTFIIAPNKNSLYGEYMPDYGVTAKTSNAKQFHSLLDQLGVAYVDLFAAFDAEEEPLYFAHDSHWNSKGAALGADLINASFGVESNYYRAMKDRIAYALNLNQDNRFLGVVWCQGEHDAADAAGHQLDQNFVFLRGRQFHFFDDKGCALGMGNSSFNSHSVPS